VELDAPKVGELAVRVEAAGVCHSDYHYMQGDLTCRLPAVLGHEGAGIVEALGPGTSGDITVGSRVAFMWRPRCGRCVACISGNPVLCASGRVQVTTGGLLDGTSRLRVGGETLHHFLGVSCFAERVVVSERAVVPVPDGVPAEIAAITGCAVVTGVGAVLNVVQRAVARGIVVFGVGGVGLCSVMGARLVGADPIVAVDVDDRRLELARRLGATHTVNAGSSDPAEQVRAIAPGGVDWAIEAIGQAGTLRQAFASLAPGGTAIALGLARAGATFEVPINELVQGQKRIVGSLYGSANPLIDLPRIFGLYLSGRLPLDDLVGERFALDSVNDAFARLTAGGIGRAVVVP
jgi:S-(hydroxymethyl)glutathione dehydrogenase/alcohol dehydrogenase